MAVRNPFSSRSKLKVGRKTYTYFSLAALEAAWGKAQAAASPAVKKQGGPRDIEALFLAADAVNRVRQPLAKAWASRCGGEHHAAPVKGEERAMQKVHRSFRADWRKLCSSRALEPRSPAHPSHLPMYPHHSPSRVTA